VKRLWLVRNCDFAFLKFYNGNIHYFFMLTKKQVKEIREHLDKAQNPVFFFDNDQDGLCSFLLLQRFAEKGRWVAVKSYPEMDKGYFRRVGELGADYIFILDKPVVGEGFWKEVEQVNIPVVWIDHHDVRADGEEVPGFVNYYNPVYNRKSTNEPVSALCYHVAQKKKDIWLAVVGCISDSFLPDFYSDFLKKYPDLGKKSDVAFDVFYDSRIGDMAKMLMAGLKDTTSNVVKMLRFLMRAKTPYDVLEETAKNRSFHQRYDFIKTKYDRLLEKALAARTESKLLLFTYGGDMSMSGELSNELMYRFPEKIIVVGYSNGVKMNLSARGDNVKKVLLKAIEGLEDSRGGGHDNAVGAQIRSGDLEEFRARLVELV